MIAAIEALDLEPIKFKIACKEDGYGWSGEYADRMELAYKRYLILHAKYPEMKLAPTRTSTLLAHAHPRHAQVRRRLRAHLRPVPAPLPYLGLRGDQDKLDQAAATLRELFVSEFGEEVPNNVRGAAGAAWCGVDPTGDKAAAWCGVDPTVDKAAAWCGNEPPIDKAAAWCGIEVKGLAAQHVPGMRPETVRDCAGKRAH